MMNVTPIRKKHLISIIESLAGFGNNPKILLEQYTTDAVSVADILYLVGVDKNDLYGKLVIDLGAGTGRLGLPTIFFGAVGVVCVEVDPDAIAVLIDNAEKLDISDRILVIEEDVIETVLSDERESKIGAVAGRIRRFARKLSEKYGPFEFPDDKPHNSEHNFYISNTVCLMNPPFGVHRKGADTSFLEYAMYLTDTIYSVHLSNPSNRRYLQRFAEKRGWKIDEIHMQILILKHTYKFHRKPLKRISADIIKYIRVTDR